MRGKKKDLREKKGGLLTKLPTKDAMKRFGIKFLFAKKMKTRLFHLRFHTTFRLHMLYHNLNWYKKWHDLRFANFAHWTILVVFMISMMFSSFGLNISNPSKAYAKSTSWTVGSDTYATDVGATVNTGGNVAELSSSYTPGNDWVANEGGNIFTRRKQITIGNTGSALTNYQVLFDGLDTTGCSQASCQDLRFTSTTTNKINYWIESGAKTASSKVWVNVPSIPNGGTTIYMYYGNSSASAASSYDSTFTKDFGESNLVGLWHMDAGSGGSMIDSSATANNGTLGPTYPTDNPSWNASDGGRWGSVSPDVVFGTGSALTFDGTGDNVTVPDNAAYHFGTGAATFSFWFKPTQTFDSSKTLSQSILTKWVDADNNLTIFLTGTDYPYSLVTRGSLALKVEGVNPNYFYICTAQNNWVAGTWYHIAFTTTGTTAQVYVNGVLNNGWSDGSGSAPNYSAITGNFLFGGDYIESGGNKLTGKYFNGSLDEFRMYNRVLGQGEIARQYVRSKYASTAPTVNVATINSTSPTSFYPTNSPTIVNNTAVSFSKLLTFTTSDTDNNGSNGKVRYQLSKDGGTTWYYYDTAAQNWLSASKTCTSATTGTSSNPCNDNEDYDAAKLYKLTSANANDTFKWRAFFISDGSQQPKLTSVTITYYYDTGAPNQTTLSSALSAVGGSAITSGTWYNHPNPYFTWNAATDNFGANPGEESSTIVGYYVFLCGENTDNGGGNCSTVVPSSAGSYVTGLSSAAASIATGGHLNSGDTYHLLVQSKDGAGGESTVADLFTYKYDTDQPTRPSVERNPVGWSDTNSFNFTWSSTDTGGSGIKGYEYKRQGDASWTFTTDAFVNSIQAYQNGTNVFQVRTLDNAGNVSDGAQINYYYAQNAPSAPQSLSANPQNNTENSFTFTWQLPATYNGGIKEYRWSVNVLPSPTNTVSTGQLTTGAIPAATQQGLNTFYVVAVDTQDHVNYANYASVLFEAQTVAPGIPIGTLISDISNRNSSPANWALAVSWNPPSSGGAVDHYIIQRSVDQSTWTQVGTSSSTDFAEAELDNTKLYFYRIIAVDNANKESSVSDLVSKQPTGKFAAHPDIRLPGVQVTATTATITWSTDRASTSFVKYGKTTGYGSSNGSPDSATTHTVTVSGLDPGTTYHYRQQSYDAERDYDINAAVGEDMTFKTLPAPGISEVKVSDIGLSSAIVAWKTTSSATSTLRYGKTNTYGTEISDISGSSATTHTVKVSGLDDSSTYHFKISGTDTDGNQMYSDDYSFDTLTFPKIENLRISQVRGNAAMLKISWNSNVPVSSTVQYTDSSGKKGEASQAVLTPKHEIVVLGIRDNTEYTLVVKGRDEHGNEVAPLSDKIRTDYDTTPPSISDIITETSISGYDVSAKSQMVVSWQTDEPSTSQVEYSKGVSGDSFSMATGEDSALTTSHVVVVSDLDPSSSYYFRVVSKDKPGNAAKSEANSVLTEEASSSIFDIVLKSFEDTLGWMVGGGN